MPTQHDADDTDTGDTTLRRELADKGGELLPNTTEPGAVDTDTPTTEPDRALPEASEQRAVPLVPGASRLRGVATAM